MFSGMAQTCYAMHYKEKISPRLTKKQKHSIAKRISNLTLQNPIWQDRKTDYIDQFPEFEGLVNVQLSGLYLVTILREIFNET